MNRYRISKCEDTGRLALYERCESGGELSWILIAHEEQFFALFDLLSQHFLTAPVQE